MVNDQTSQYELLNKKINLSRLGIYQYVRVILQYSLPLDHPVAPSIRKVRLKINIQKQTCLQRYQTEVDQYSGSTSI